MAEKETMRETSRKCPTFSGEESEYENWMMLLEDWLIFFHYTLKNINFPQKFIPTPYILNTCQKAFLLTPLLLQIYKNPHTLSIFSLVLSHISALV